MMEHKWKLGEDMILSDNLLDPITFDELVMTVRCNCREITKDAVKQEARSIFNSRWEDFMFILENNYEEIIKEVKRQKGME